MNIRLRIIASIVTLSALTSYAQSPATTSEPDSIDIVRELNSTGRINITQPDGIQLRDTPTDNDENADNSGVSRPRSGTGYRVEVFADNNVRTAKSRATAKQRNIKARLPQYRVYLTFQSPYWRVRVGDFRTRGEAEGAMAEIRRLFPSYSSDLRIVRDRINK